jgi:hypothetical protein
MLSPASKWSDVSSQSTRPRNWPTRHARRTKSRLLAQRSGRPCPPSSPACLSRAARVWHEELLTNAVAARELRADTDVRALARLIEVTLRGSFLNWTLYREGSSADWLREDLDDMLRPHLARGQTAGGDEHELVAMVPFDRPLR